MPAAHADRDRRARVLAQDMGLFGPESVAWRLHRHPALLLGGLRALMVQALHPLAMAAVAQYSDYRKDVWGRYSRTTMYVVTTIFGSTRQAQAAAAAKAAADTVKRVAQELGGKSPNIILSDADFETAVVKGVQGCFGNTG